MNLGQEIRKRRIALGWTQQELALRAGVHPNSIVAYEKGNREPYLSSVIMIFGAMGYNLVIVPATKVISKGVSNEQDC